MPEVVESVDEELVGFVDIGTDDAEESAAFACLPLSVDPVSEREPASGDFDPCITGHMEMPVFVPVCPDRLACGVGGDLDGVGQGDVRRVMPVLDAENDA